MAPRRDKGEGSIFQRTRNNRVEWVARLTVPRDVAPSGRVERIARTQREARQVLAALKREVESGRLSPGARQTVASYLTAWLEETVYPHRRARTAASYEQLVRVHLVPALGEVPLGDLTPPHMRRLINDLLAAGKAPRTAQYVHAVLRGALNQAVRDGLIDVNPAARVAAPSVPHRETVPLTAAQAGRFLTAVRGHRLEAVYRVAFALGLREGEVIGLRWDNIDLAAGRLTVRWTIGRVRARDAAERPKRQRSRLVVDEPKSARSRRTIALPASCTAALTAHRERQVVERRLAGDCWHEHGLVFPSTIGTPLEPRRLLTHFQTTCAQLGLTPPGRKQFVFHDLRHTAASFLLAQGVPLRVVMEILGHSQIALTANLYSHVAPEVQREAADRMDALVRHLGAPDEAPPVTDTPPDRGRKDSDDDAGAGSVTRVARWPRGRSRA